MKEIILFRENNLIIRQRPLKIFIDGKFIDYVEPSEKSKKLFLENGAELSIKMNSCSSNVINLIDSTNNGKLKINIVSQVQNSFYIFAMILFLSAFFLHFVFGVISAYIGIVLIIPFFYVAYWYTLGRKNFLRLTKL